MTIRTTKRLVELEDEYGGNGREVDKVKLKRVALELKTWLKTVDPNNDPFGFLRKDLPLVDAVLQNTIELPFAGYRPHAWELGEGLLPSDYRRVSAPFYNTISGSNLVTNHDKDGYVTGITIIEKDGKRYAWAEFEEPEEATP